MGQLNVAGTQNLDQHMAIVDVDLTSRPTKNYCKTKITYVPGINLLNITAEIPNSSLANILYKSLDQLSVNYSDQPWREMS